MYEDYLTFALGKGRLAKQAMELFEKTGKVKLEYDKNKKTITLITCVDQDIQIVYIGYLIDEINY